MQENVVYIGNKPVMNYVLAVITQFNNNASEVAIKARGKAISRAVDVEQIVKNRFMPDVKTLDIKTSTEEVTGQDGRKVNISAIEIVLSREGEEKPKEDVPKENVVYIGNKPVMNYVLAVITQFNNNASEVAIKARGKAISRAVDVEQIVKNRFMPDVKTKAIYTNTETVQTPDGRTLNVSAIDIVLTR